MINSMCAERKQTSVVIFSFNFTTFFISLPLIGFAITKQKQLQNIEERSYKNAFKLAVVLK